jgi:hypothetical protein
MTAYATLQDVYRLGLSAQAFVVRPRKLDPNAGDALDPATGTFRLIGHGLGADDIVQLVLVGGPGVAAVPTGATANTPYSPIPLDFYRFQLASVPNGSALTFADVGTGAWAIQVDPEARLMANIIQFSAELNQDLIAHGTPLVPDPTSGTFPQIIVGVVAREVARRVVTSLQVENAAFKVATDRLFALQKDDNEQRERWRNGQPILPKPLDQTPTKADDAARAWGRHPVGWGMRRAI